MNGLHAQLGNNTVENEQNMRQLANIGPLSPGARTFDNRYEGVKGSPYLFEEWVDGKIFIKGNEQSEKELKVNINQYQNQLVVLFASGEAGSVPAGKIHEVVVETPSGDRLFRVYPEFLVDNNKNEQPRFFEVLHDGEFTILKSHDKMFQEADYKGAYSVDRRYDQFLDQSKYYIRVAGEDFDSFQKLKRRNLEKALPGFEDEIRSLEKKNDLDLKEEADVLKLMEKLEETVQ